MDQINGKNKNMGRWKGKKPQHILDCFDKTININKSISEMEPNQTTKVFFDEINQNLIHGKKANLIRWKGKKPANIKSAFS